MFLLSDRNRNRLRENGNKVPEGIQHIFVLNCLNTTVAKAGLLQPLMLPDALPVTELRVDHEAIHSF